MHHMDDAYMRLSTGAVFFLRLVQDSWLTRALLYHFLSLVPCGILCCRFQSFSFMEPLSVSASIVGLLTAGAAVTAVIRNIREAPTIAQDVASEITGITACLSQLQLFLDGTVTAFSSRTSLIMLDQIFVVLTNCVKIFSELQEILNELKQDQQKRVINALRWTWKEQKISKLLLRLQASQVSLNLMLTTINR